MSHKDLAAKYAAQLAEAQQQIWKLEKAAADSKAESERTKRLVTPQCGDSTAEVVHLQNKLEKQDEQITNLNAEIGTAQQKFDEYQVHIASLKSKIDELCTESETEAERVRHLRDELQTERVASAQQQGLITSLEGNVSDLEAKLKANAARETERIQHLHNKLESERAASTQQQDLIATLERNVSDLKTKLEASTTREIELAARADASLREVGDHRARIAILERKLELGQSEYDEKTNRIGEIGGELTKSNMEVERLKRKNAALKREAGSVQSALKKREKKIDELHQQLEKIRFSTSSVDKESISQLKEQLTAAQVEALARTTELEAKEKEVNHLCFILGEKERKQTELERKLQALQLHSNREHEEAASARAKEELVGRDTSILELHFALTEQVDEMGKQQQGSRTLCATVGRLEAEASGQKARGSPVPSIVEARRHDFTVQQVQIDELKGLLEGERKRNASTFWQTAELKALLQAREEKIREADKESKDFEKEIKSLQADLGTKNRKISELRHEVKQLRPERQTADEDLIRVLESELTESREENQDRVKDVMELDEALRVLKEKLRRAEEGDDRRKRKRC